MALTTRATDFSEWYNQLVEQADLAQHSAVRGCMVIKPYGYAIWENMQQILDKAFKATGHQNAYFPLFIPKSFFTREAKHVEHFATEAAIVTHYRMKRDEKTGEIVVDPDAKLEEELIVRPTSETIIWDTFRGWIKSYRDLPLLINQRANVVRREMRTRYFLRTAEFLRQEGHTAHATAEDAIAETEKIWELYNDFLTNALALDGVMGVKTENEKFAGGEKTYTVECMMQDGKAIQSCTSHFLGQNFGKAFDVQFTTQDNTQEYAWATSRGISTRSYGAMIMAHSDDKGLVLPPAIAPIHIVIVPVAKSNEDLNAIKQYLAPSLQKLHTSELKIGQGNLVSFTRSLSIKIDEDLEKSMGRKANQYELQGVPLRVTVGARDIANGTVEVYRRDLDTKEVVKIDELADYCEQTLAEIQSGLLAKNKAFREANTVSVDTRDDFVLALDAGKFVMAHRDGTTETEVLIKEETKATIRCIPIPPAPLPKGGADQAGGLCIRTGKPSKGRVLFARAY